MAVETLTRERQDDVTRWLRHAEFFVGEAERELGRARDAVQVCGMADEWELLRAHVASLVGNRERLKVLRLRLEADRAKE